MNDAHIAMRYDAAQITDAEKVSRARRMVGRLLAESLTDHLLNNQDRPYAIRLTVDDEEYQGYYHPREIVRELRIGLTWHQAERMEIREYIDFRPMDWMTLSQTATEEIRRRIRNWWRRPLAVRVWNWQRRMAYFEKKHFGRAFDGRNKKSGAIVGT